MKYTFQWKDPDWDGVQDIPNDEEYLKLRKLGLGEYIVVDVDTETMTATIRERKS